MPQKVLAKMGSQLELTAARQNQKEAAESVRRQSALVVNPTFEPEDFAPPSLSPVKNDPDETEDRSIHLVSMKDENMREVEEYEPYDNRIVKKPTSNLDTLIHLMKGSLGTGILAMPRAFVNAGYIVGTFGTVIIGVLCTYCIHVLLDSCYELCKRRKVASFTYTAAAKAALSEGPNCCKTCAPYAGHVVNVFLLIYQIGTCCVYVVFVSENIHFILRKYQIDITLLEVMLYVLPFLIAINCLPNLKILVPISAFANLLTLISFAIILYYIFREPLSFEGKTPVGDVANFPLFFGTVLFALEAIGVILPLENEMKTPKSFVGTFGVLNRAMVIIVTLYVAMGLFGYLQFGNESKGSITLNLPKGELYAVLAQGLLSISIFITHALACYVAIDILWKDYVGIRLLNNNHRLVWEYTLRIIIVLITFGLAAAVPMLDLFISLFGALCLSALGLAFPVVIQTCTYWNYVSRAERIRMLIKNSIIVLLGLLGFLVGTWTSLERIIEEFMKSPEKAVLNSTYIDIVYDTTSVPIVMDLK